MSRTSICVAICTYQRNEPLRNLLEALTIVAERVRDRASVGVVVCDDNTDQRAEPVVRSFCDRFELGSTYVTSGRQNISLARNAALEAALDIAEWVAMTDDDCEPSANWLGDLLDLQQATGADAVTGQMVLRAPEGAPDWLTNEPFLEAGVLRFEDGARADTAGTNNSMISSAWLRSHPEIRFDERLGRLGGEDMVFYRTGEKAGLHIRFSQRAHVHGNEPPERATLAHQLRSHWWLGNTEAVTNLEVGDASRPRLILRGGRRLGRALVRPIRRMLSGSSPQLRYTLASTLHAIGMIAGALGVRLRHH